MKSWARSLPWEARGCALAFGMRVIAANSAPCLRCYHCRRGQENLCDDLLFNNGAYAEYMRIPGRIVRRICWKYRTLSMTIAQHWWNLWRA